MRLIEDVICIVLLVLLPNCILERCGLYGAMDTIMKGRIANDAES